MFTLRCLVDNHPLDAAIFHSEHGVAFAIETPSGQVLFDTGQSGEVLVHNAARMGFDLRQVDALAFSHAHYDHTGGLRAFLKHSRPGLPLYANPDLFRERFAFHEGQYRSIGLRMKPADLTRHLDLRLNAEPVEIFPHLWTTGEITPRAEFEGRSPHHYIQENKRWLPDPYRDDMALVLEAKSGLVVICGCCHAGLLNTLAHVRRVFDQRIAVIIGGAHLADVNPATLEHAIAVLRATSAGHLPDLFLNHCTGERALAVLAQAFGENVHPCPAGTVLRFE
ncbi:MAG: MBL fold metallo-hydrolase [Anaerolineales bacterium]|nr:MBL fold metallo-hydrolase [Anaerolineales bacterium]